MGENPKRTAGADQCRWCKALAHCPEAYEYIKKNTQDEIDMEAIGNEELSEKMGFAPLLERFIKEVKDLVRARLEKDIEVPEFKLRSTGKITTIILLKLRRFSLTLISVWRSSWDVVRSRNLH